ncbi:hypothetical protein ABB07_37745 [Streptomyces incarnatus]|uniref:Uncharacterized protein n=1 Tax=Streptomyces incarnatus TaxID=665007 RepID=A0ABN4GP85_9ACTN|nr:hypothetical protein [Streptomyces incarnatus]AKJ15605.1 hypothetical protein ABB07_37745 [Streptomyces incarnatus]
MGSKQDGKGGPVGPDRLARVLVADHMTLRRQVEWDSCVIGGEVYDRARRDAVDRLRRRSRSVTQSSPVPSKVMSGSGIGVGAVERTLQ